MDANQVARHHAALIQQLGGAACVLPVPALDAGMHEVGELSGLPCWSGIGTGAETRRIARGLARRGALGLLITEHPGGGSRHFAVTLDPVRVVAVPIDVHGALPLRRLTQSLDRDFGEPLLARAVAMATALDVDASGRATFAALRSLLEDGALLLPTRTPIHVRHEWLLVQLTRLLFLRFVEREGWLNGEATFLGNRFDACFGSGKDPHRHLLAPLFFGTLNRPPTQRSRLAHSFGRIPFLNGGLFEPHEHERRYRFALPADFWRRTVDHLVLHTEVTLEPNALDGSVTPEMLGRVFEGVMTPQQRKQDGAFFTPPSLVTAVVREALVSHLAPRLDRAEESVRGALDNPDRAMQRAMLDTSVLDPAVGSGAFLIGALHLLHGPGAPDRRRVRHLVTRRLHGVDRNPAAVRLTELRLWLEVLRATRGEAVERIRPLPNLDATIRAGDALLDPVFGRLGLPMVRRLRLAQAGLAGRHGSAKRERLRALQRAEASALTEALEEGERTIDVQIREIVAAARAPTLFGESVPVGVRDRRRLRELHGTRRMLRRELRRLQVGTTAVPFAMATAFAPVLQGRGGFDLVVGNPPWVRAEALPRETREALALRYRWWRSPRVQGFRHLPDLAIAFVERSVDLLAPTGTLALLLPTKLTTASYATMARAALGRQHTLHVVADLDDDPRAGFDATVYPLALIASRRTPEAAHTTRTGLAPDAERHPQQEWATNGPWLLTSRTALRVVQRLRDQFVPLASVFTPQLGAKTGANTAFLDPPESLAGWTRLAVRGRDVRAYCAAPEQRLLWPADDRGEPWERLPSEVAEHLRSFEARLRSRTDYAGGPWWRIFRVRAATAAHRVVWGDLAPCLEAALLPNAQWIPLNSCYVIAAPSAHVAHVLAHWLNSTWIRALARLSAEPAAGGAVRFGARAVGAVPWVSAALTYPAFCPPPEAHTAASSDEAVAELLGLSTDDCAALASLATRRR